MELIRFKNYSAYYKLKKDKYYVALKNIDLGINKGEFLAVTGASGCGKTTFVKSLLGANEFVEGEILFDGKDLCGVNISEQNIGYVAQEYSLYPSMTVYENIAYPLRLMKTNSAETDKRVKEISEKLEISYILSRKPRQLSGGQQSRVSIARALIKHPRIILFDEPFANLAPDMRVQMRELIKTIHSEYRPTVIFVTHDLDEAFYLADRILVLKKGAVEQLDTVEKIRTEPISEPIREYLCEQRKAF